jgi:hypothetical protein
MAMEFLDQSPDLRDDILTIADVLGCAQSKNEINCGH